MQASLIDTDTLSAIMRKEPTSLVRSSAYLLVHGVLTISIITRYEVLRGLNAKQATAQTAAFERFCLANTVLPITDSIIIRAAGLYGELHRRGALIGDADILIAATALEHGLVLVTNNTNHFTRIPGLQLENWRT